MTNRLNTDKAIVNKCLALLEETVEETINVLYSSIDNFLFQDINFSIVSSNMPKWILDEGISPEGVLTKDAYEKCRRKVTHPIFGLYMYYYELWTIVAAIQDRLQAVSMFLTQFYDNIPCIAKFTNNQYTSGSRQCGEFETSLHVLLNSIFVSYASVFDLLSKVAREEYVFDKYDFTSYKEMKSNSVLYNFNMRDIAQSLKGEGMLFSAPLVVRKFCTFRNEYVHNGPWDMRACVYYMAVNGEPADVIIYSPDMDDYGNFIKSGSRNKFYSQSNRINIQLPDMIIELTEIIRNTITELSNLYQAKTVRTVSSKYTAECINAIMQYYKSL